MRKIIHVSRLLKWTVIAICLALPLIEAGYWITNGYPFLKPIFHPADLPKFGTRVIGWTDLNEVQKLLGFLINLLPLAFSMAALIYLSQLFGAFERLKLFEKKNVQILKRAGWTLVWGQIIYPLYIAGLSLALTYRNPIGQRNISIGIGPHQIEILAIGLSILLASWIFEEAAKIQEEQAGTV